jgi:hypothetical protein
MAAMNPSVLVRLARAEAMDAVQDSTYDADSDSRGDA